MSNKYHENECVVAKRQLTDQVQPGTVGAIINISGDYLYGVEFDIASNDLNDRWIDVKEEDLLPYEG